MKISTSRVDLRVALLYALFGVLWIALSEQVLAALVTEPATMVIVETYKGWVFVAISALVIFVLLRRELSLRHIAENESQLHEERYRLLFEHSNDAILLASPEGMIYAANPAACRLFGQTEAELQALGRDGIMDPADERLPAVLETRASIGTFHGELTFIRKDGSKFTGEVSSNAFLDPQGNERTSTFIRDISRRKLAEAKLRQSEQKFSILFQRSAFAISLSKLPEGIIVDVNETFEKTFGYSRPEVLGKTTLELGLNPDSEGRARILSMLQEQGSAHDLELGLHTRSGELRYFFVNVDLVEIGDQKYILNTTQDITARKQAEEKLQYQADLLGNVRDAVIAADEKYMLTSWNRAAEEMFGWQEDEVLGKSGVEVLRSEFIGIDRPDALRLVNETGQYRGEMVQYRKDGTPLFVEANTYTVRNADGNITGYVTVSRDITERKRAEEALRTLNAELEQHVAERTLELTYANRAKDEFLANMSHELRTPLTTILGLSEILLEQRRGPLTEAQNQAIELISASGKHLLGLINDILEVSKIEAGKLEIHPSVISVQEICESSLNFVRQLAIKKSIALDCWNNQDISSLFADPQRLKQILINLLTNAVKFTPEHGNVSLEVELNEERDEIQFIVSDNGIGIASEDLQKLFTPFTQLDNALTRQYSGTGLGLVLVYKFTELHGGSVQVESEIGRGSRFTIHLPWAPVDIPGQNPNMESIPAESVEEPQTPPVSQVKVLLADDHEINTMMLSDYLQAYGYEVTTAQNGVEALAKAGEILPHIILIHIQMAQMDGLETIGHLRADQRFRSTPIIAITALAMAGDRERCLAAGANEYLSKPISLKTLTAKIQELVGQVK